MARELPSVDLDEIDVLAEDLEPSARFTLGGEEWFIRHGDAVDQWALGRAMSTNDLERLIRAIIIPEQVDELLEVLNRPNVYTGARAAALTKLLTEATADRPTRRSNVSSRGPKKTGRTSPAASSSEDTAQSQLGA